MDKVSDFFNNLFEEIKSKPTLAGWITALIGLGMLIAVIMDADWMLEGGNGYFNIATISNMFGRTTARVLMGILSIIIMGVGLVMVWGYSQLQ